jgi:putative chitinase
MAMNKTDIQKFLFLYADQYGVLTESQKAGITSILTAIFEDQNITDIRQVAYMLATVKHECAGKWQPIAEIGKGEGKKYGIPDHITGQVYYGRGYVQLTWLDNYRAAGIYTKTDLVNNPDLAMQPDTAYKIMSWGMRRGAFTGVGLSKYIHDETCDYFAARKIINGLDCAQKIAAYARTIQTLLEQSAEV